MNHPREAVNLEHQYLEFLKQLHSSLRRRDVYAHIRICACMRSFHSPLQRYPGPAMISNDSRRKGTLLKMEQKWGKGEKG